ncbi:unnamed protein product, partial [Closterium sp. NIES-53]
MASSDGPRCPPAQLAVLVFTAQQRISAPVVDWEAEQHKNVKSFWVHATHPRPLPGQYRTPRRTHRRIFWLPSLCSDAADWEEENVDGASEAAGPLPYCSVPIPMDDENPRDSVNADTYYHFADTGYVTPQPVNTNISERYGPGFTPDSEAGDEAVYPEDPLLNLSRHTSLRILLAVAASRRLPLRQIDVTNAFLYAPVDVNIFVEQPHGFVDDPSLVCQLLKSLYGIKQAPRLWQQYLHARLKRIGFDQLPHDQGMYRLTRDNDYILLIVYVDDLLYIESTTAIVTWFEKELQTDLSLTVSPDVTQYLGLNILDEDNAIHLSASKYA